MTFFCSKCGFSGDRGGTHLKPKGSGRVCNYEPVELEPISQEKARELLKQYGWDLQDSSEPETSD